MQFRTFTLAEGAAHAKISADKCKAAFTLAEVLITLGIIGIVAAMTLPAIIQKQQEKIRITQLKKVYSILSQAFNSAVYDTGYDPKDWGMGGMYDKNSHIRMAEKFIPYLNISENCINKNSSYIQKHCVSGSLSDVSSYASVRLADGTTIIFRIWNGNCRAIYGTSKQLQNVCGHIFIDLNNIHKPNITGQDRFNFYMTNYGIVPIGTPFEKNLTFENYCDKSRGWETAYGGYNNGISCTAWALYNENMEYLHCSGLSWNGKGKCK